MFFTGGNVKPEPKIQSQMQGGTKAFNFDIHPTTCVYSSYWVSVFVFCSRMTLLPSPLSASFLVSVTLVVTWIPAASQSRLHSRLTCQAEGEFINLARNGPPDGLAGVSAVTGPTVNSHSEIGPQRSLSACGKRGSCLQVHNPKSRTVASPPTGHLGPCIPAHPSIIKVLTRPAVCRKALSRMPSINFEFSRKNLPEALVTSCSWSFLYTGCSPSNGYVTYM